MHLKRSYLGIAALIVILALCIGPAATGAAGSGNTLSPNTLPVENTAPDSIVQQEVSPVTATAYKHNETIWTSSSAQVVTESWYTALADGSIPTHWSNTYTFSIKPTESVWVMTPFTYSIKKNGVTPKVRYLYFQMFMPEGVNVTGYTVYSGQNGIQTKSLTWEGTGAIKTYTLDLGGYYIMNKGINAGVAVKNTKLTAQPVYMYGAGAKQEW
jgi:hypothetical protein